MNVEVDPEDLLSRKADSRGRITLGSQYEDLLVTVAVVKVEANQ